jgi:predicted Zn-dependent protease
MSKSFAHLSAFVVLFFTLWWGLSNISWMKTFKIQEFTKEKQEQIAELVLKMYRAEKKEIESPEILDKINKIKDIICKANNINSKDIQMHVFEDEVVNAFALPGGHIVVNTSLITKCDSVDELAGVMAHEMAHVQLSHVSRKLSREIGMSTLMVLSGGGEHLGTLKEVLNTLSSRSFDRDMEREADKQAIKYMEKAKGDPKQLAYFLEKLTKEKEDLPEVLQWISTHPGGKERVDYILKGSPDNASSGIITKEEWAELKKAVEKIDAY